MKMIKSIVLTSVLFSTQAVAELAYQGTSVGAQAGIYGLGLNLKGKLTDTLGVKVGFDQFTYNDIEITDDQVKYNFDVKTKDFLGTLDWHPWATSFKLSAGMIVNDTTLEGYILPNTDNTQNIEFTFNDVQYSYSTDELGSIKTNAEFDPVAPYVGIGWDTSFTEVEGLGFTFDLGIAHQGAAKTSYELIYGDALDVEKATANIPDSAQKEAAIASINAKRKEIDDALKSDIDKEMKSLQTEIDKYEWMPYIAIGVNYKF